MIPSTRLQRATAWLQHETAKHPGADGGHLPETTTEHAAAALAHAIDWTDRTLLAVTAHR